jgi:hypothetical protein
VNLLHHQPACPLKWHHFLPVGTCDVSKHFADFMTIWHELTDKNPGAARRKKPRVKVRATRTHPQLQARRARR